MYVITGATGNIGRRIVEILLDKGEDVTAIGRNEEKLQELSRRGAHGLVGDLADTDFLTKAFAGATAVFTMIPPNWQAQDFRAFQNQIGESIAEALRRAKVTHVVNLSSLGADLPENTGPILGLHDQEQRLNNLPDLNVVHLRPTYFMENLLGSLEVIKNQGVMGTGLRGGLKFPAIATRDIAPIAADYLLQHDFTGHIVRELLGPQDISLEEITPIIGQAIGHPELSYVQFPYDQLRQGMVDGGVSPSAAEQLVELNKSMNDGLVISNTRRSPDNTTETGFAEFADIFAEQYRR
jgi:uncharacterized protein YbjT (DUF2867 family)